MSEKHKPPSRILFYLISFTLFLTLSSILLLHSDDYSFVHESVFDLILANNISISFKPYVKREPVQPFLFHSASPVDVSEQLIPQHVHYDKSNGSDNFGALRQKEWKERDPSQTILRIYMYDLPPEFHFGILGWKGSVGHVWPNVNDPNQIPPYPGGLNLQHSIEYWLTIDLLLSNAPNVERPCTAIRVMNSSEADVIFVPFFSSLSYNKYSKFRRTEKLGADDKVLQDRLVKFLMRKDEWKRMGGKDHLIVSHHPNSMLNARRKLGPAIFVLADFGRYPVEIANLNKDVIAPYKHLVRTVACDYSAPFDKRPILAYFQGAIYRKDKGAIRQELYYLLKDEKDVHFAFGNIQGDGISKAGRGMAMSKFCLNIAGDTPSSNRLFDAIASHCVPVIISDEIELPFEDVLDYSEFCVFVKASDATKAGFLLNLLRAIGRNKWTQMWNRLKEVEHHFEYQFPSRSGDAVDMIWQAVSRKRSSLQFESYRMNRYQESPHL